VLTALKSLAIDSNLLSGVIPTELGMLAAVTQLCAALRALRCNRGTRPDLAI
jgi:hypothetical protein